MNDYGVSVLEQYGMQDCQVKRTRGAVLCQKDNEWYLLRPFIGNQKKLEIQQEILLQLKSDMPIVDYFLENNENLLVSKDKDGEEYTLQKWYEGRECNLGQDEDIKKCAKKMAEFHRKAHRSFEEKYEARSLTEEYEKHNRELRKIRKFIRKKGVSNAFEKMYLEYAETFLERGELASRKLQDSKYEMLRSQVQEKGSLCHGEVNQHNFLLTPKGVGLINVNHWNYDIQVADLYYFLRKILEKYGWDIRYLEMVLEQYEKVKPLTKEEKENLEIRFWFPEKFWKLANYYFSHNKVWISGKNIEKLSILTKQQREWEKFMKKCKEKDYF